MKPRLTRRELVAAGTAGLALTSVPDAWAARLLERTPRLGPGDFMDGVASGEPSARAVTLWSRLATDRPRSGAELIVAEDEGFERVVARSVVPTGRGINGTLKARVGGLEPRTEYFYKWISGTDESDTGRTLTAPAAGSNETLRIGVSSCQNFPFGFYPPMRDAVERGVDLKLFLGDYMYETARNGPVRRDPIAATDLASYREKYRLNRSDPALRELHRLVPMAHIWDDHEVTDNYNETAESQQDETDQTNPGQARQVAELRQRTFGYRAAFEWLPRMTEPTERHRIYRKLSYGGLLDIFLLDTRQYRTGNGSVRGSAVQDSGPGSRLLNPRQMAWLRRGLRESTAKWKLIAQQVVVATIYYDGAVVQNPDAWDGHQDERDLLLDDIAGANGGDPIDNVVWITGDVHAFIANQLPRRFDRTTYGSQGMPSVSTEYVPGSVTSPGIPTPPANVRAAAPWNEIYDGATRGYGVLDFTDSRLNTDFRGAPGFPSAATPLTTLYSFAQAEGANRIQTVAPRQVRRRRR